MDQQLVTIGVKYPQQTSEELVKKATRPGVFIKTFGCQMNEYDSRKLAKILEPSFSSVSTPEQAELVIVNTCSVREKAETKLYSVLGQLAALKRANPKLLIGVGGCVAQQEGASIIKRSKAVDFVFGTHNLSLVPSLIAQRRAGSAPQVAINYRDEWEDLPLGFAQNGVPAVSVFIAISRGCNKNCSYCIVPVTRGPEVSRARAEIEREARIAVLNGVKEVVLLGQTVNSYGLDFRPRSSFVKLLECLAAIEGLERIRFTSPHPQEVRTDFIDFMTSNPKVCRHVHMPLQSGSDRILKSMNRNYRREKYLSIIEALKTRAPDIAITTDIIVGFPGESEADFQETLDIMELVEFESSFSFMFSARPGTLAASMPDTVSPEEKLRRLQLLQAKQDLITTRKLEAWVGKDTELLLEGPSASHPERLRGRNSQNIMVNLHAEYAGLRAGQLVNVKVCEASRYTLKAEIV